MALVRYYFLVQVLLFLYLFSGLFELLGGVAAPAVEVVAAAGVRAPSGEAWADLAVAVAGLPVDGAEEVALEAVADLVVSAVESPEEVAPAEAGSRLWLQLVLVRTSRSTGQGTTNSSLVNVR